MITTMFRFDPETIDGHNGFDRNAKTAVIVNTDTIEYASPFVVRGEFVGMQLHFQSGKMFVVDIKPEELFKVMKVST